MARWKEPTDEQEARYLDFVASLPPHVRVVAERFEPWSLYRLKTSNHRVAVISFDEAEDGSVTLLVTVSAEYNAVMFERNVFGIDPNNLEPCELPAVEEATGALLSQEEVHENIDLIRTLTGVDVKH